jgi:hypothetical protein
MARAWEDRRLPRGATSTLAVVFLPLGAALLYPGLPLGAKGLLYSEILGLFRPLLALSFLTLGALPYLLQRSGRTRAAIVALLAASAFFLTALFAPLPRFDSLRSARGLAEVLEPLVREEDEVAVYSDYLHGLAYYLERRITVVDYLGELRFGTTSEARTRAWMIGGSELMERWRGGTRIYLVIDERSRRQSIGPLSGREVGRSGAFVIVANR